MKNTLSNQIPYRNYQFYLEMSISPLQLKLQLLHSLRSGNIEQIQQLLSKIQTTTKINPELYQKFNKFITENKQGLIQMQKQQRQQNEQPKIIIENVQGDIDDGYNSEQSWSVDDSQQEEEQQMQQKNTKQILKQVNNKPSTPLSQSIKKQNKTPTNPQYAFKKNSINPTSSLTALNNKITKSRN